MEKEVLVNQSLKKVAVIGSRNFTDYKFMREKLFHFLNISEIEEIISGGAIGADSLASKFATEMDIPFTAILPDYDNLGKRAPYLRNIEIAQSCDILVAFWNGISKGTDFTIKEAKKFNKEIIVCMIKP